MQCAAVALSDYAMLLKIDANLLPICMFNAHFFGEKMFT